jgi:hypothetical protein
VTEFVDREELPFTQDELFQAGRQFLPDDAAHQMAAHLAACAPDLIAARAERRRVWRNAGIADADTRLLHGWAYPDQLLPSLCRLSVDAAQRVASLEQRLAPRHRDQAV